MIIPEVVVMATFGAASDDNISIGTNIDFRWREIIELMVYLYSGMKNVGIPDGEGYLSKGALIETHWAAKINSQQKENRDASDRSCLFSIMIQNGICLIIHAWWYSAACFKIGQHAMSPRYCLIYIYIYDISVVMISSGVLLRSRPNFRLVRQNTDWYITKRRLKWYWDPPLSLYLLRQSLIISIFGTTIWYFSWFYYEVMQHLHFSVCSDGCLRIVKET